MNGFKVSPPNLLGNREPGVEQWMASGYEVEHTSQLVSTSIFLLKIAIKLVSVLLTSSLGSFTSFKE